MIRFFIPPLWRSAIWVGSHSKRKMSHEVGIRKSHDQELRWSGQHLPDPQVRRDHRDGAGLPAPRYERVHDAGWSRHRGGRGLLRAGHLDGATGPRCDYPGGNRELDPRGGSWNRECAAVHGPPHVRRQGSCPVRGPQPG